MVEALARFWQGFESPIIRLSHTALFIFCRTQFSRSLEEVEGHFRLGVIHTSPAWNNTESWSQSARPRLRSLRGVGPGDVLRAKESRICLRKWAARLRTYQQLFLLVGAGIPLRDGSRCAPRLKLVLSMHVSVGQCSGSAGRLLTRPSAMGCRTHRTNK